MSLRQIRVAVLGGGSWGTTVASLVAANTETVTWARDATVVRQIADEHRNRKYLGDLLLHPQLRATTDLEAAVHDADVPVLGVPSHGMRATLEAAASYVRPWIPIISLTKGLEQSTRLRMTQVVEQVLPGHPAGVLAGLNIAREVLAGFAAAAVIAMPDGRIATSLQRIFCSPVFRVYTNNGRAPL